MTPSAYRGRAASLHMFLLAQSAVSVFPAMALVALGSPERAAQYYFLTLFAQLGYYLFTRNRLSFVTLFVSTIPAAMMLRDQFMFNSVIMLLAIGFALWFAVAYEEFRAIWSNRALSIFLVVSLLYWWVSFLRNGQYTSNLRILELALCAASIVLLGRYRSYLGTALVGIGLSTIAVGAGLSPYGDRLGMAEIGDESLGNPISLGLPAALTLILVLAYKGHWLLAETRPMLRAVLSMGVAATLLLSTSRGSWLVCIIGLLVLFAGSRRRGSIVVGLAPIALGGMLALASGRGASVATYLDRAISPDRSMAQRTTGRYRQWQAMPQILERSPLVGFGPGSGLETNQRFTGSRKAWHSLYLHLAVETGVVGICLLVLLLGALWWKGVTHWKTTRDIIPLVGTVCFMTIAVSVSGMDANSGIYLGIAFLGRDLRNLYVVREVVLQNTAPAPA